MYAERFTKHLAAHTSNAILSRVIPGAEGYISLGIAVLNAFMTFPAIYLVEVCTYPMLSAIYVCTRAQACIGCKACSNRN